MAAPAHDTTLIPRARSERGSPKGLVVLAVLAAAVFCVSLLVGSSGTGLRGSLAALMGSGDEATRTVLLVVRLPRVLAAFGVGSLLALAGVLLQALFRNPLADPYVLGVSGGAAVGALLAMMAGLAALAVQSAALAGALVAVVTVYLLARSGGTPRLLLTGVVLASACGALVSVLLTLADTSRVRGMVFWLAGDLEWAVTPWASAGAAIFAVVAAVLVARPLNVLAAGELRARSRDRGGECRHRRLRRTHHAARRAARLSHQRPPHRRTGRRALRRHAARARRPRGAHHRESAPAARRGHHGARGGAAVRRDPARPRPLTRADPSRAEAIPACAPARLDTQALTCL
jgi:ABC-type cobalamin transport system permease subunit